MRRHWQKEALLVRSAMAGFEGFVARDDLFALAMRDDVESRLVRKERGRWSLVRGPLSRTLLRRLPPRDWTLLVQGVNLHVREADALLRKFAFISYARLDDVMVSYAAPGGGVGPHVDAYDVFLLQGLGRRRWRYGRQDDHAFRPDLPLRILRRFTPSHDAVLGPGDMLYLPPQYAHDGIALEACTTYSIGFRAPSANELARAFLDLLHDHLCLPGDYRDPDLAPTREPARIDRSMLARVERMLRAVRWGRDDVQRFLGLWLSEPKPTVFFDQPAPALTRAAFARRACREGICLDRRTQLLYDEERVYINGDEVKRDPADALITTLANARCLAPAAFAQASTAALDLVHDWYRNGYLQLGNGA